MKQSDFLKQITDKLIADLEAIKVSGKKSIWTCPWKGSPFPMNMTTDAYYNGINIILLWSAADANGYKHNKWLTFNQKNTLASKLGLDIRIIKGQKGHHICRWVDFIPKDQQSFPVNEQRRVQTMKVFKVFNIDQLEGLPESYYDTPDLAPMDRRLEKAHEWVANTGAEYRVDGHRAAYSPMGDYILSPKYEAFKSEEDYFATMFHELGHWTGHKSRCDRQITNRPGSKEYAFEEIIAEMTAAFLCAHHGVEGKLQHVEYIDGYIQCLQDSNDTIRKAATQSSKAFAFLTEGKKEAIAA